MSTNKEELSPEDLRAWEKKRARTLFGFVCQAAALGMEYSLTFITLWLYLEDVLQTRHAKLFYSIISAAYLSSQVVSSMIFGRIVDRYRNISNMFLLGNGLVILGNTLYMLPFSAWLLFGGRLISGGGGCLRSIMTGVLARSYKPEELSSKFSIMGMAFGLGFILGPGINFAFLKANFYLGEVHITYANAPGFYLAILFVLMQIAATFLVSDLSKEYDLKEHLHANKENTKVADIERHETDPLLATDMLLTEKRTISSKQVLVTIMKHVDSALIIVLSFSFMYCMVSFDLWQPLVVVKLMDWGVLEINLIIFGYGIASVVVLLCFAYRPLNDHHIVYFSMACTLSITMIQIMFIIFKLYHSNQILNIVLWIIYGILFAVIVVMEEVFLIGVMAKMTSSSVQSFTESIRLACSRMGALIALLTAAIAFPKLEYVCATLALLSFLGFWMLVLRRKSLQNPKILIR